MPARPNRKACVAQGEARLQPCVPESPGNDGWNRDLCLIRTQALVFILSALADGNSINQVHIANKWIDHCAEIAWNIYFG